MAQTRPTQLMLRSADGCTPLASLCSTPVLLGRDEGSHVVIRQPAISRHHLLVWARDNDVVVRDLGSTLGTRVGSRQLGPGDSVVVPQGVEIRLGGCTTLFWAPGGAEVTVAPPLAIVAPAPERRADPLRTTGIWSDPTLGEQHGMLPVTTIPQIVGVESVALTISMGIGGPLEARLESEGGIDVRVRGETRVVLLYLLASQVLRLEAGVAESSWLDDRRLLVGLWGTRGARLPKARQNTVIARVRKQTRAAGVLSSVIQKEAGKTRLSGGVGSIVIDDAAVGGAPTLPRFTP